MGHQVIDWATSNDIEAMLISLGDASFAVELRLFAADCVPPKACANLLAESVSFLTSRPKQETFRKQHAQMLLEAAIGDAFGAGYEYVKHKGLHSVDKLAYVQHPRHRDTKPGMYTDDTQMSIAIAELLVSGGEFTRYNVAESFVTCFHRDPRGGYAKGFYQFLCGTKSADSFLARIRSNSDKSGAAMRASAIGLLPDIKTVKDYARIQASVTHNSDGGINSATAAALVVHYFTYAYGSRQKLPHWVNANVDGNWSRPYDDKVGSKGWMSVSAAITAVSRNTSLAELLMDCINFGGDVDTVATIALAAASCSSDYEHDIPDTLVSGLENRSYGRKYIVELDTRLATLIHCA